MSASPQADDRTPNPATPSDRAFRGSANRPGPDAGAPHSHAAQVGVAQVGVAQERALDTDTSVNADSLNRHLRTRHVVAAIRRVPLIGVDSPALTGATVAGSSAAKDRKPADAKPPVEADASGGEPVAAEDEAGGTVVALRPGAPVLPGGFATRPAGRPSTAVIAALDNANRVAALKATSMLGWVGGESLYAACLPGRVVVRAGQPSEPTHLPVTIDSRKHLRLPRAAVAVLGVVAAGQVMAIATPVGELILANAAVVAEMVTGVFPYAEPAPAAPEAHASDARRPRVRPRWQPPAIAPTG